eukprot:3480430-Rhodomonas_salina.1
MGPPSSSSWVRFAPRTLRAPHHSHGERRDSLGRSGGSVWRERGERVGGRKGDGAECGCVSRDRVGVCCRRARGS